MKLPSCEYLVLSALLMAATIHAAPEVPEALRYPYISTYYVNPTVTTKETVPIRFFVTDWSNSRVRFGDKPSLFDVHLRCVCPDGKVRERTLEKVPSGDAEIELRAQPKGEYHFCVWAVDEGGRESHRVWHRFRVVEPGELAASSEATSKVTPEDLVAFSITTNSADRLGRLLDFKAKSGIRKVVMLPGTYQIGATNKVSIPGGMTFDLNGATLTRSPSERSGLALVDIDGVRDAHLVNGVLEGGFRIASSALYCSVEGVVVTNVAEGCGGWNGMGRGGAFYDSLPLGEWEKGGLDAKSGKVVSDGAERSTCGFVDIRPAIDTGWLQVSAEAGGKGMAGAMWQMTGCWYDAGRRFLSSETLFQSRIVPIPAKAAYLRVSLYENVPGEAKLAGLAVAHFRVPRNCVVRNCTFDGCRVLGYAAGAMKNVLFEGNVFRRCGGDKSRCMASDIDGQDMMQDVTFRGNVCKDNAGGYDFIITGGHNFVFTKNSFDIECGPRVYSPCVSGNDIGSAVFSCEDLLRSGYSRFERNRYGKSLRLTGAAGCLTGVDFSERKVSVANAIGCTLVKCEVDRPPEGRWTEVKMEEGMVTLLYSTNEFVKCSFKGVEFERASGGEQTFRGCTFENCSFLAADGASLRFEDCAFKGGSVSTGPAPLEVAPSRLVFTRCAFDTSGKCFIRTGANAIGSILMDKCKADASDGKCDRFIDIFDFRSSEDASGSGMVVVMDSEFGKGVPVVVGCSTIAAKAHLKPGEEPRKLEFTFSRNKLLAEGAAERGPLPQ